MKKIKLGDIGKIFNGTTIPNSEGIFPAYGGNGIIKNVSNFNFEENVIAIGRVGAHCGVVHFCERKCWITDNCLCFKPNEKFNSYYVFYLLKFLNLNQFHIGSAQPLITQSIINEITLDFVPSLETQKKIGDFLYSLDQKIALNKKINATLEEMAKTFFLHKFFRKPANGKIADILIENAKSTVPVGVAKNSVGDFPFFTSGENILRFDSFLVDGRNIFLNTGGNAGVNFYVGKSHYSTDTWCISTKNLSDYLYLLLKIIEPELNKKFFQGTGLKHLQKDLLKKFAIYIPTDQEREHFNKFVCPLFDTISKNQHENNLLENLRDFLLPMLMNGQVTFAEED